MGRETDFAECSDSTTYDEERATFTVAEIEDDKDGSGYIGEGTICEFATDAKSNVERALEAILDQAASDPKNESASDK